MRTGLRVQLLALLGTLFLIALVPLFFVIETNLRVGIDHVKKKSARALAVSITSHIDEAGSRLSETQLLDLLSAQVQGGAVQALFVYDRAGHISARAGHPEFLGLLGQVPDPTTHAARELETSRGPAWLLFTPTQSGGVAALLHVGSSAQETSRLTSLMGLYLGLSALLVLLVAYFALTRWIVRPILALENAAERIAQGGRSLKPLESGPAELVHLSQSLVTMTRKLHEEEDSLRKKIEEVESATEKLKAAQTSLVRSERLATVGRLSAGLAHEIGNPISALMGFEDLLLEGNLSPEEQRDFLERMRKETTRIHRVLGDLLAYARPGSSLSLAHAEAPGSVEEAARDVLALLRPQKTFQDVCFHAEISPNLPRVLLSHEELTQVLLNLIMNAVDACERKGQVRLEAEPTASGVRLIVEDDGPGIAAHVADTLFEPFVSTKEIGKGTGLGLAVTRGLVEGRGGSIHHDKAHSPGARFVVVLPSSGAGSVASTSSSTVTD